jgi:hypothetical protein
MESRRSAIERVLRVIDPDLIERDVARVDSSVTAIDEVDIDLVADVLTIDKIDPEAAAASKEAPPRRQQPHA